MQIMHKDTLVAQSKDGVYEWEVVNAGLLPIGLDFVSVDQVVAQLGMPRFTSQDELVAWMAKRDKARDTARQTNQRKMLNWLKDRVLPLDREHAKLVYSNLGIEQGKSEDDKAKISIRFKAVSIMDNYWLKDEDESATWAEINPREVPLSKGFAIVALTGGKTEAGLQQEVGDITDSKVAAEVSAIGTFPKGVFRREGYVYMLKTGSRRSVIAEWLSTKILSCTNIYGYLSYEIDPGDGSHGFPVTGVLSSYCRLMTNENRDIVMAKAFGGYAEEYAKTHFPRQFAQIAVIDFLIGNGDRHGGNWGFFREAPTWQITGLHWVYDNNWAFKPIEYFGKGASVTSIVGRGKPNARTLKEGALDQLATAQLQFIRPVEAKWFYELDDGERYLNEFKRRCHLLGLTPRFI